MENLNLLEMGAISTIWALPILLWLCIIVSGIYWVCVVYTTDGDKSPRTLGQMYRDKTGLHLASLVVFTVGYFFVGAVFVGFIYQGWLLPILYILGTLATIYFTMRISRTIYRVNKAFKAHTKDKNAHK